METLFYSKDMKFQEKAIDVEDLAHAVLEGDFQTVKVCISSDVDVNALFKLNELSTSLTPLMIVASSMNATLSSPSPVEGQTVSEYILTQLVSANADVHRTNDNQETALYLAVLNNNIALVRLLLAAKASVDASESSPCIPLVAAVQSGSTDMVDLLLSHGAEVNCGGVELTTPLYAATLKHDIPIMHTLIRAQADPNALGAVGYPPLFLACQLNHDDSAALLIDAKANPNTPYQTFTPLLAATQQGFLALVTLLIKSGADLDAVGPEHMSALLVACEKGWFEIVKVLLAAHADHTCLSADGAGPLYTAAHYGHTDIVGYLVDSGLERGDALDDALFAAAQGGHGKVVDLLINKGANANYVSSCGNSILDAAADFGNIRVIRTLIDHKAQVNRVSSAGFSPLSRAALKNHATAVGMLLNAGGDISVCGGEWLHDLVAPEYFAIFKTLVSNKADITVLRNGYSLLSLAVLYNLPNTVEMLIDVKADVNVYKEDSGNTCLHYAAENNFSRVLVVLLSRGAKVNQRNCFGETALMTAVKFCSIEAMYILLKHGANTDLLSNDGSCALSLVCKLGRTDMLQVLLDAKADLSPSPKCSNPLSVAIAANVGLPFIKTLLEANATTSINQCGMDGLSALAVAAGVGHVDVVEALIIAGADVDSAMFTAVAKGHTHVVTCLIEGGANVNASDKDGFTLVAVAAEAGFVDVVRVLSQHKADINKCNNQYVTPLMLAASTDVVQSLVELKADGNIPAVPVGSSLVSAGKLSPIIEAHK